MTEVREMREVDEIIALKGDVEALRSELKGLLDVIHGDGFPKPASGLREAFNNWTPRVKEAFEKFGHAVSEKSKVAVEKTREGVRKYPISVTVGALLAGLVTGILIARARR